MDYTSKRTETPLGTEWKTNGWMDFSERFLGNPMTDPWDERHIYLLIYHQFKPNVGKYTSPMDPMGNGIGMEVASFFPWFCWIHLEGVLVSKLTNRKSSI